MLSGVFHNKLQKELLKYQNSIFINYNELLSWLQTNSESIMSSSNISPIAENFKKASQVTYPDISGIIDNFTKGSQIVYPDMSGILENVRKASQVTYPDISGIIDNSTKGSQIVYPDMSGILENVRKTSQVIYPDISSIIDNFTKGSQLTNANLKIIRDSLANFQIQINDLDFTEEDVIEANEILSGDHPVTIVEKEGNLKDYIPKPIWIIITIIYVLMEFLNNIVGVTNFVEEKIPVVMEHYQEYIVGSHNITERESVKWLSNTIKKDTEQQITQNFRIVTKDNLVVRESNKVSSKSQGSLKHGSVVQIVEKKKNWTYIHYSDHIESTLIEGWVFTRYLKQIK